MKPSEPDTKSSKSLVHTWQARNFLRAMKLGQQAFFYHSNCKEPGIVGIVKVSPSFSFCVSGEVGREVIRDGLSNSSLALLLSQHQRSAKVVQSEQRISLEHLAQCYISQQGWLRHLSPEKWNQTAAFLLTFQSFSSQVKCCSTLWLKCDSLNSSQLSPQGSSIKPRAQKIFFFKRKTRHKDYHHLTNFPLLPVLLPHCSPKRWWCFSHTILQCFDPRNVKERNISHH